MAIKILNDLLPIAEQTEVGVVKPDNVSITITETGELQSSVVDLPEEVVTAENYDNPKLWKGTLEEYNAIETKNPLVTYIITDDNVETLKTTDYNALSNKPSINDVTLEGNKTLEELNIQPADTSLTTSQITNCITKIPQDIKLELVDGTLTLKAGSKVYVPNGFEDDGTTPKFDAVVIESDKTYTATSNSTMALFYTPTLSTLNGALVSILGSGISIPTTSDSIYYKIDTNTLAYYKAGALQHYRSFPLALFTISNNTITSIDQVFNGFGYIGNTLFILPGIEGLIPKGRNADGSLNNTKFITMHTAIKVISGNSDCVFAVYTPQAIPTATAFHNYSYSENENYNYFNGVKTSQFMIFAYGKLATNRITSFSPKTTFNAIDRNNTEWASTASKPSNRYIDLTLGASGSTYTAPANGWVQLVKTPTGENQYLVANSLDISNTGVDTNNIAFKWSNANGLNDSIFFPVRKGQQFTIGYTFGGTTISFKFIYDEGVR